MKSEMEQMRLQSELSTCNVENTSSSSTAKMKNTIVGLQNEVAVEKVQRESNVRHYNALIQQL